MAKVTTTDDEGKAGGDEGDVQGHDGEHLEVSNAPRLSYWPPPPPRFIDSVTTQFPMTIAWVSLYPRPAAAHF